VIITLAYSVKIFSGHKDINSIRFFCESKKYSLHLYPITKSSHFIRKQYMENFSTQWFLAFYVSLGALLMSYGVFLLIKTDRMKEYLLSVAENDTPPPSWKKILKYLLLFTLPGLFLSFIPFSWIELLFSLWALLIIFVAGQLILVWQHTSQAILENKHSLKRKIRFVAANMMSIGIILFLLSYVLLERSGTFS